VEPPPIILSTTKIFAAGSGSITILPSTCGSTPEVYNYNRSNPKYKGIDDFRKGGQEEFDIIKEAKEIVDSCPFYEGIRDLVNEYYIEAQAHFFTSQNHEKRKVRGFGSNCLSAINARLISIGKAHKESIEGELAVSDPISITGITNSLYELFSFGQQCEMPQEPSEQDSPDEQTSDDEQQDIPDEAPEEEEEEEEEKKVVKICPKSAKFRPINNVNGFSKVTNRANFKIVKQSQGSMGYVYSCMYKRAGVQSVALYRFISLSQCSIQGPMIECN